MTESAAGTWASLAGTEIVNDARTLSYLRAGLGPGSVNIYGDCACPNMFDLIGCVPEEVVLDQYVDLPGVAGNYISTPDTALNSLSGTAFALRLSGHSGTRVSTPDSAALSITGDIDIRWRGALDNWNTGVVQPLVTKREAGGLGGYGIRISSGGNLEIVWSAGAVDVFRSTSLAAAGLIPGQEKWLRVTMDVDNGAAGSTRQFFYSNDGVIWILLFNDVTAGVTSIADGPAALEIGTHFGGTGAITGTVYQAQVLNGINNLLVANPDFTTTPWVAGDIASTARADSLGNVWTLTGNANIRLISEVRTVRLTGAAGTFVSTPDSAVFDILGDLDVRAKVAMDDWTPATVMQPIGRVQGDPNRHFRFTINTGGFLQLEWWPTGSVASSISKISSAVTGLADGSTKWIRATLDVDNGAAGHSVIFYLSDDGVTWVQLGTTQTAAGITSLANVTAPLEVGSGFSGTSNMLTGNVFYAEVRNGIDGTIVASPNFFDLPWTAGDVSPTARADANGNTWTLNGAAVIQRAFASDLDIRVKVALDDWTPSSVKTLLSKYGSSSQQRSYLFWVNTNGTLGFWHSFTGVIGINKNGATPISVVDGEIKWVRVVFDVDNGAGGYDVKFYTSDDGITWTQLGATITTAMVTAIFDGTTTVEIGAYNGGLNELANGNFYYASVRNGIDGVIVAEFDANSVPATSANTPNTVPNTVGVWTINGALWTWGNGAYTFPFFPLVGPNDYVSPAVDNAPWYTADIPASAEFLGMVLDEFEGMDSPFTRDVKESVGNGGVLTRSRLGTRSMTWRGFLFGATCCATQYGLRWLTKTLSRFDTGCRDCFGDDLELLVCCPDEGEVGDSPFRLLKGVGLVEGPKILSERKTCASGCAYGCGGSCIIEVEFTLVATQPYFYSPVIPVYDCVNLVEGSINPPLTNDEVECGEPNCTDIFFASGPCILPELPPTAGYLNSCLTPFFNPTANYFSVSRSYWNDLEEVVPVISITTGALPVTRITLGFYSSFNDSPCSDLSLSPPDCDVICDNLDIFFIPADSTFYIDGRTRKMAIICPNGVSYPGESLTSGPWSWPTFDCYGFCVEVIFEEDDSAASLACISLSLVPRTF